MSSFVCVGICVCWHLCVSAFVYVVISLSRDFVFYGKRDLCVRFRVTDGSSNEHCRLDICTLLFPG